MHAHVYVYILNVLYPHSIIMFEMWKMKSIHILFYIIKANKIGKNLKKKVITLETVGKNYWQDIFKISVLIKKISMKKKVTLEMPK